MGAHKLTVVASDVILVLRRVCWWCVVVRHVRSGAACTRVCCWGRGKGPRW